MMGFSIRKKEVVPVLQPSLQEQLTTALAKVQECEQNIKAHDAAHIQFVHDFQVITDGDNQACGTMNDSYGSVEIAQRYNDFKRKRNQLEYEFSSALSAWADLKQRVNT
jgi:hypothetical protein